MNAVSRAPAGAVVALAALLCGACEAPCHPNCGCRLYETPDLEGPVRVLTDTVATGGADSLEVEMQFFFGEVLKEDSEGRPQPTGSFAGQVRRAWLDVSGADQNVTHTLPVVFDGPVTEEAPRRVGSSPVPLLPGRYTLRSLNFEYLYQDQCPMTGESWTLLFQPIPLSTGEFVVVEPG